MVVGGVFFLIKQASPIDDVCLEMVVMFRKAFSGFIQHYLFSILWSFYFLNSICLKKSVCGLKENTSVIYRDCQAIIFYIFNVILVELSVDVIYCISQFFSLKAKEDVQ